MRNIRNIIGCVSVWCLGTTFTSRLIDFILYVWWYFFYFVLCNVHESIINALIESVKLNLEQQKWATNSTMLEESNKFVENLSFVCDIMKPLHCWQKQPKKHSQFPFENAFNCYRKYNYLYYKIPIPRIFQRENSILRISVKCMPNIFIIAMTLLSIFFLAYFYCDKNPVSLVHLLLLFSFRHFNYGLLFFLNLHLISIHTSFLLSYFRSISVFLSFSLLSHRVQ